MFEPMTIVGNLTIGTLDVSRQAREMRISARRDVYQIPPTPANREWGFGAAAARWQLDVFYMSNPALGDTLTDVLWEAFTTAPHTITFAGSTRPGTIGVDNPLYSGTIVVTAWELGGGPKTLATHRVTYPMTAAPSRSVNP